MLVRDKINDDTERQPDVGEREPGEEQGEGVVLLSELGYTLPECKT